MCIVFLRKLLSRYLWKSLHVFDEYLSYDARHYSRKQNIHELCWHHPISTPFECQISKHIHVLVHRPPHHDCVLMQLEPERALWWLAVNL